MDIIQQIFGLLIISMATASISWTVTQEEIYREAREFCKTKTENLSSLLQRKFFYLFTCEYCFSHWATTFLLFITGFRLYLDDWRGVGLAFFVIPWLLNQMTSIYRRLRVSIKHENALADQVIEEVNK